MRNINQTLMTGRRLASAILIVLTGGMALLSSCTYEEEDLFDQSAAQRLNASAEYWKNLLESSEYGWVMEFIPYDGRYGGWSYTADFERGKVDMRLMGTVYENGDTIKSGQKRSSYYSVKPEQGVILTFDTFNELLHGWTKPSSSSTEGAHSDYEFVFKRQSENQDTIILHGKKYGNELRLTRLLYDAEKYIDNCSQIRKTFQLLNLNEIIINGEAYPFAFKDLTLDVFNQTGYNILSVKDVENNDSLITVPFFINDKGIRLTEDLKLSNGTILREFRCSEDNTGFYEISQQAMIPFPSLYEQLTNSRYPWLFQIDGDYAEMGDYLFELFKRASYNYPEGVPDGPLIMFRYIYPFLYFALHKPVFRNEIFRWQDDPNNAYPEGWLNEKYSGWSLSLSIYNDDLMIGGVNSVAYDISLGIVSKEDELNYIYELEGFGLGNIRGSFDAEGTLPCRSYPQMDFFQEFPQNSPYRVTFDDDKVATRVKFVSVNNPDCWFNLVLTQRNGPLGIIF